ncbi:MAG: hypothetical protein QOF26_1198 [Baekduia sp.]|nr:hypothetical protein [Baekduia sp.]
MARTIAGAASPVSPLRGSIVPSGRVITGFYAGRSLPDVSGLRPPVRLKQ